MPLHIAPILHFSDDMLEEIIQAAAQDSDGCYDHETILTLSHVCTRLRQITLCRASFWNYLDIGEDTTPEVVQAILRRSQQVPLHISIFGTGMFKRIRASSTTLETLFEAISERLVAAHGLFVSELRGIDCEVLSRACKKANPMRNNAQMRKLDISCSSFPDSTLKLAVGAHLAVLELAFLQKPLASTLSKILHLAPNIEVLCIFGLDQGTLSQKSPISQPHAHGVRLQIFRLELICHRNVEFARVIELVRSYSPQLISDGRIVELRDSSDTTCITEMNLQRFKDVQSIICNGGSAFKIQYPAQVIPTQRPVGQHAFAELQRQSGEIELVTRGFDVSLWDLFELRVECPAREVLRHSMTMTRSLTLYKTSSWNTLQLFTILAHDAWPMLEHISLELCANLSLMTYPPDRSRSRHQPINIPRLYTLDVALYTFVEGDRLPNSSLSEIVRSWVGVCVAIILSISWPQTARFTLRTLESQAGTDVAGFHAAVCRALESESIQFETTLSATAG